MHSILILFQVNVHNYYTNTTLAHKKTHLKAPSSQKEHSR